MKIQNTRNSERKAKTKALASTPLLKASTVAKMVPMVTKRSKKNLIMVIVYQTQLAASNIRDGSPVAL